MATKRVEKECYAFYHPRSNLSGNKPGCFSLQKVVQKAESSCFLQQNLYMLRVLPAQGKLVLQQVT